MAERTMKELDIPCGAWYVWCDCLRTVGGSWLFDAVSLRYAAGATTDGQRRSACWAVRGLLCLGVADNHTQERATQERTRIEYVLLSEETWPELIAKGELGVVGLTMSTQRLELLGERLRSGGMDRTVLDLVETATSATRDVARSCAEHNARQQT